MENRVEKLFFGDLSLAYPGTATWCLVKNEVFPRVLFRPLYERVWPSPSLDMKDYHGRTRWWDVNAIVASGRPEAYMLFGPGEIELFPISDAIYSMRMWYTKTYAPVAATDTEIEMPNPFNDVLVYGTVKRERLYRRDRVNDIEPEFAAAYGRAMANMQPRRDDGPHIVNYTEAYGEYI